MIKRALISVYDKSGLEALVEALGGYGVGSINSGGGARKSRGSGDGKSGEGRG